MVIHAVKKELTYDVGISRIAVIEVFEAAGQIEEERVTTTAKRTNNNSSR